MKIVRQTLERSPISAIMKSENFKKKFIMTTVRSLHLKRNSTLYNKKLTESFSRLKVYMSRLSSDTIRRHNSRREGIRLQLKMCTNESKILKETWYLSETRTGT